MLYGIRRLSFLGEFSSVMPACEVKLSHLNLNNFPKRCTLSDANANPTSAIFATICDVLLDKYAKDLSDSSSLRLPVKHFKLVDSRTINLFAAILKGVGSNPINGKKKGGIKMHTMINAMENVSCLVRFSNKARHDHTFIKELDLKKGSLVVFDKDYTAYRHHFDRKQQDIYCVTSQKDNASY
jgi:hypothetical protein